ncbi:hypothetical protein MSG28_007590, partial [Choristoneura fumiferana]
MNVHTDCMPQVGKCQTKSRLLRRQKSTSEIESHRVQETAFDEERVEDGWLPGQRLTKISFKGSIEFDDDFDSYYDEEEEVDQTYQVLKRANEIAKPGGGGPVVRVSAAPEEPPPARSPARPAVAGLAGLAVAPQPVSSSSGLRRTRASSLLRSSCAVGRRPPRWYRQRGGRPAASLRLSLVFSSVEFFLHAFDIVAGAGRGRGAVVSGAVLSGPCPRRGDAARRRHAAAPVRRRQEFVHVGLSFAPQLATTPVHFSAGKYAPKAAVAQRSLTVSQLRNELCLSRPLNGLQCLVSDKHQRLLPTNLYVILYNFKSRHADELDLKAGYKVTVIDTSDPDWWKGKCLGKIGYFPSKYCTKLQAGERPLQVTHNLQVSDGDNGLMLLRDQIVIQVGDEVDGMVMIRSGDNRQGVCPIKFLQEKRGSFTEETHTLYVPKPIQSAPVTPCDSEASTWSDRASSSRQYYELPSTSDNARYDERPSTSDNTRYNAPSTSDKTRYEESMEGVWWWRRPLGVRRNQCRRCGASSATRPLRMMPCAGVAQEHDDLDWDGRRPLMSRKMEKIESALDVLSRAATMVQPCPAYPASDSDGF